MTSAEPQPQHIMYHRPRVFLNQIEFSSGQVLELNPTDTILLVGPNNSGKSQCLREILSNVSNDRSGRPLVVTDLALKKDKNASELQSFLDCKAQYDPKTNTYYYEDWSMPAGHLNSWDQSTIPKWMMPGFVKLISADERLKICDQQTSIGPSDRKHKPQHFLYADDMLMEKISELFESAFGKSLLIDFRGGQNIPIHVGERPPASVGTDRVSSDYVEAVRKNPLLDRQGDGIRSFAGILFEAIALKRDVILIDEPEAFLHPPQMRVLGRILATEVSGQLIVATHSSDVMRGFLEATRGDVRVWRMERTGDKNQVFESPRTAGHKLWERPQLRYSNALESIFHEQTIICEDDSDCRIINAFVDDIILESQELRIDNAYVPAGGKHAVPKIASVLAAVGVPLKAIFDIDFLSEENLVEESVKAFGGDWETLELLWKRVNAIVTHDIQPKSASQIKGEIRRAIDCAENDYVPQREIRDALKSDQPWAILKRCGVSAIPSGNPTREFNKLWEELAAIGIYIIKVGKIENFIKDIGSHGPKFVTTLLRDVELRDPRLAKMREFVKQVHRGSHSATGMQK